MVPRLNFDIEEPVLNIETPEFVDTIPKFRAMPHIPNPKTANKTGFGKRLWNAWNHFENKISKHKS